LIGLFSITLIVLFGAGCDRTPVEPGDTASWLKQDMKDTLIEHKFIPGKMALICRK